MISSAYALYFVFNDLPVYLRLSAAVLFGLVWGLMILNLDRFIVSSMKKNGSRWRELRLAIPRLFLAAMIAITISKPLELTIFHTSIDYEMEIMKHDDIKKQEEALAQRYAGDISLLENSITALQGQIDVATSERNALDHEARIEADGTGGSSRRGLAQIYPLKKADADKAQTELDTITAHNSPLISEQRMQLTKLHMMVDSMQQNIQRGAYDGFDKRLIALATISERNPVIATAGIFVMLLFLILEMSPVLVKLLSPRGPYDDLLEVHEHAFTNYRIEKIAKMDSDTKERLARLGVNVDFGSANTAPA
ncbi:MAG: DUF4407 domain-containing protein [Flavobacteriales bacterium]|nr:DUF4407 domain-containing protein [Flavobacteriales bacterium]